MCNIICAMSFHLIDTDLCIMRSNISRIHIATTSARILIQLLKPAIANEVT